MTTAETALAWSKLDDEEMLTTSQVAEWLGISKSKLNKARMAPGVGPKFLKFDSAVRYRVREVREWMNEKMRASTRTGFTTGFLEDTFPSPEDIAEWLNPK